MAERSIYPEPETKQEQKGDWQLQTHNPDMHDMQTNGKNGQQTTTIDIRKQQLLLQTKKWIPLLSFHNRSPAHIGNWNV
jgi:hypothetical protein